MSSPPSVSLLRELRTEGSAGCFEIRSIRHQQVTNVVGILALCKVFTLESGLLVRASSPFKRRNEMTCVREERSPGRSTLHISGPLRVPLRRDLELAVHAVLRGGVRRIELNLAAVSDLDAGGVGVLVRVYNLAAGAHCALRIVSSPARVQELLCKAGLIDLLTREARWWWPRAV